MRISTIPDDPGYDLKAFRYTVFLDSQELHDCFTADEELGKAWIYVRGRDGAFRCDRSGKNLIEACVEGDIEIVEN